MVRNEDAPTCITSQYTFMTELNNKLVEHLKKLVNKNETSEHPTT
jgi:hypothetical protein